ncbi:MAG: hypothetical protein ACT4PU_03215 [Planctomycetota bacterium]
MSAAADSSEGTNPGAVPMGEGRSQLKDEVVLRLGVLRGLSNFLARQVRPDGVLFCPRHRVEHTGKNVYAAVIDLANWRYTREESYLERARRAVLRAVDNLGEDPASRVPVFLPGRVDPRNASTNSIDGGACTDSIATLLEEAPQAFSESERQRCADAVTRHVDGYLRHAARDRPIPAQRLWAGTGVARAARWLGRRDWAADAQAGCALALDELAADGVAPYIPLGSKDCSHPGLSDTSTFYHSRTPGFVLYIHELLQAEGGALRGDADRQRLRLALHALVAMRDGLSRKVIHNEAKPWYWESDYEVASHPFDAYALWRGAAVLGEPLYKNEAGRVMEEWIAHIGPDGGADSHHGRGVNFQCRIFWTAHAAWVARIIEDVPLHPAPRADLMLNLPVSGLVHVERARCTAVLRGARQPSSNLFGCDLGGGSLQSLVVRSDARSAPREAVPRRRFQRERPASFLLRPAGAPGRWTRLLEVLRADRSDLRFRLYITGVEWRAGRWWQALGYPWRHVLLRSWREASPWLASHLAVETTQSVQDDTVVFTGGLAGRDGRSWPGCRTVRRYTFLPERVELHDVLQLAGVPGRVRYELPAELRGVECTAQGGQLVRRGRFLSLVAPPRGREDVVELSIRGFWPLTTK